MKTSLQLVIDTRWPLRELAGQRVVAIGEPDILLAWGGLVPYPDDVERWKQRALAVEVAVDATIDVHAREAMTTRIGWRFDLVEARILRAGEVVEARVAAFYKFLEYGAVALVRARDRAAIDRTRAEILALLVTGAPSWSPVCLHELLAPRG
jgi:hypothetical protein